MNRTWNKLLEFETRDLVERYIKNKHGRTASKRQVIEITSNFIQAREYFRNAKQSDISVKPLLQHYAVASMTRGLILATSPHLSEASLKPAHGLETKNWKESLATKKFEDLTVNITNGTFYELLKATNNKSYFKHNSNGISWNTSVRKFLERSKKHVSTPMFTLKSSLYPENKSLSNTNTFCGEIVTLRTPSLTSLHT